MNAAEFGLFEFSVGSTRGIREFRIDALGRLTGVSHTAVWRPGENLAVCDRTKPTPECVDKHDHQYFMLGRYGTYGEPKPGKKLMDSYRAGECNNPNPCGGLDPDCGCGFYAYYGEESQYAGSIKDSLTGVIEAYGKTIVGTRGFRAEKAKIVALCIPSPKAKSAVEKAAAISTLAKGFARYFLAPLLTLPATILAPWPWKFLALAAFGVCVGICAAEFFDRRSTAKRKRVVVPGAVPTTNQTHDAVRLHYADVPIFESVEAMLAEFPTDQRADITPLTDPSFWDREAQF